MPLRERFQEVERKVYRSAIDKYFSAAQELLAAEKPSDPLTALNHANKGSELASQYGIDATGQIQTFKDYFSAFIQRKINSLEANAERGEELFGEVAKMRKCIEKATELGYID